MKIYPYAGLFQLKEKAFFVKLKTQAINSIYTDLDPLFQKYISGYLL